MKKIFLVLIFICSCAPHIDYKDKFLVTDIVPLCESGKRYEYCTITISQVKADETIYKSEKLFEFDGSCRDYKIGDEFLVVRAEEHRKEK
jgi:hypothetical protein